VLVPKLLPEQLSRLIRINEPPSKILGTLNFNFGDSILDYVKKLYCIVAFACYWNVSSD